ncbi:MAG TPA: ABC transporter permease [Gemmatimonadales bacterium]|nr:ABC transporter permease [Gemmatimonadales bacterium]
MDLIHDVRQAVRSLARRPAFVTVVVLTLALGIGANSAIFSVVNAVLLKPLPYREPDRLALIWSRWSNFDKTWVSEAEYVDYQGMKRVFEDVASWGENGEVAITGPEGPESVAAMQMTANMLPVLGVVPAAGRGFTAEEDIPNGPPVVMLGYDLWQRRYGGDPSVVNRQIQLDGQSSTVVGVLPRSFRFPLEFQSRTTAQLIQPIQTDRSSPIRGNHGQYAIGRLRPGVTPEQVTSELKVLTSRWTTVEGLYPEAMRFTAFAVSLTDEVSGKIQLALVVLASAVGLLLLLTCANVANLVLTRADARSREVAVRAALGAGKRHMLRLALTESLLLGLSGGMLGLLLSWAGVRLLVARAPTTVPRLAELSVDPTVLGFTLLLSVLTGVLFGLIPVAQVTRMNLAGVLHEGGRGQSGGPGRRRGRTLLVIAEMALAVLLVIGAGLTIRSFRNLQRVDPGFEGRNVLTFRLTLPTTRYADAQAVEGFYQNLGDQVRLLPGVRAAGFVRVLPLAAEIGDAGLQIEDKPTPPNEPGRSADWQAVSPGFFEAMGMRLSSGRFFDGTDQSGGNPVVIINQTLAREYFPGEDPLGKRLRIFGGNQQPWRTIVGVVGDYHHNGLLTPVKRAWFVPQNQWSLSTGGQPRRSMTMAIRSRTDPRLLLGPVRSMVTKMDPDLPLTQVTTMDAVLSAATQEQRFTMALMAGFALLALVLAAVGIYGVISYSVSQRTREIGIRLALGADVGTVRTLVLRQGMTPAVAGIGLGLGLAILLTRYLRTLLYGVAPLDPLTFATIPLLLMVVAVGSVLIPAARASRVAPVEALRGE